MGVRYLLIQLLIFTAAMNKVHAGSFSVQPIESFEPLSAAKIKRARSFLKNYSCLLFPDLPLSDNYIELQPRNLNNDGTITLVDVVHVLDDLRNNYIYFADRSITVRVLPQDSQSFYRIEVSAEKPALALMSRGAVVVEVSQSFQLALPFWNNSITASPADERELHLVCRYFAK